MDTERFAERLATQQVAVCAEQLQRAKVRFHAPMLYIYALESNRGGLY